MKRESMKKEFLAYASQRFIWCNYERFQHWEEEYASVEDYIKDNPKVLDDWLKERGEELSAKVCVHCGIHFIDKTKPRKARFCSVKCKSADWRARHPSYTKNYYLRTKNKEK